METGIENRFRNLVYGVALAIMIGWILYVGSAIFIPVIAAIIVAYIIVTIARRMADIPLVGPYLPVWLRYTSSILAIIGALASVVLLVITNIGQVITLAPHYQAKLLGLIQGIAVRFGVETQPTWATLRRDVLGEISFQNILGSTVTSVSAIAGTLFVVIVYTGFLLAERRMFERKLARLSPRANETAFLRILVDDINDRIGEYLALKTFVNFVLGMISWAVLAVVGLDLAAFWAVMIAVLNFIPFIGSFLGVMFPTILAVVQFDTYTTIAITFAGLTAAQVFVGSVLEPSVMGRQLNLSPFAILLSVTVWASLWGAVGALLAVPITAIMVIVFSEFEGLRPFAILLSRNGNIPRRLKRGRAMRRKPAVPAGGDALATRKLAATGIESSKPAETKGESLQPVRANPAH